MRLARRFTATSNDLVEVLVAASSWVQRHRDACSSRRKHDGARRQDPSVPSARRIPPLAARTCRGHNADCLRFYRPRCDHVVADVLARIAGTPPQP
jgi:hypothetical protein